MRHDETEILSAFLDGELSPAETAELERRLEEDAELSALLEELAAVRAAAAELEPRSPERDLWPGIAERIRSGRARDPAARRGRRRTITFTVPQLAAAAVALLALGSGVMWSVGRAGSGGGNVPAVASGDAGVLTPEAGDVRLAAADPSEPVSRTSDDVIADLERRLEEGRSWLDSSTVRVLEESLATIDRAIGQATKALALDPGNAWLTRHLAEAKARKVRLLERANALATSRA